MENSTKVQCHMQCRMDILSWTMPFNSLVNMSQNKIPTYARSLPKMRSQFHEPHCYILSNPIWFATTIMRTKSFWQFSRPLYHVIYNTYWGGECMNTINYKFFHNTCLLASSTFLSALSMPNCLTMDISMSSCLYLKCCAQQSVLCWKPWHVFFNIRYTDLGLTKQRFINYIANTSLHICWTKHLLLKLWDKYMLFHFLIFPKFLIWTRGAGAHTL